ncbi:hypothetical protein [Streptomyces sp. NPDC059709]|uniref:hypothetical protein n=1 Tax=Streptomyces sp. NPDC059709 TaxID=3346917 RepID=UPI0036C7CF22
MDAGDEGTGDAVSQPHPVTFGPGTAGRAEPAERLRAAGPTPVTGVGTVPGSRRGPGLPRDRPVRWMSEEGRSRRRERRPGGWRLRLVAGFAVRGDEAAGKPAAPASGRS